MKLLDIAILQGDFAFILFDSNHRCRSSLHLWKFFAWPYQLCQIPYLACGQCRNMPYLTMKWRFCRYTLVARKGRAPLYWGSDNGDGDSLLISTVPAYLSPFPPGCAFEVIT